MSEPDAYGATIFGIVSSRVERGAPATRRNRALAERAEQLLIRSLPQTRVVADIFRNLAFATCEISEQTGSARKTKRRPALS